MKTLLLLLPLAQAAPPATEATGELPTGLFVGGILIFTGLLDVILGVFVLGPRIPDEAQRRRLIAIMGGAAFLMITLGALFVSGVISLDS